MKLYTYPSPTPFLAQNCAFLEKREAVNSLLYGLALTHQKAGDEAGPLFLLSVQDEGEPIFCALQTPPRKLVVCGEVAHAEAIAALASNYISENAITIPGINGPRAFAEALADAWSRRQGIGWNVSRRSGVFQLDALRPVSPAPGRLRLAEEAESGLAAGWRLAFIPELGMEAEAPGQARQATAGMIRENRLYFWENKGRPVSMAAVGRPTPHGVSVYYVYTPPEYRGHGYASNAVAAMSGLMLNRGYRFCTLFTDLSNPTSNKIYQAMGYYLVEEFVEITFSLP